MKIASDRHVPGRRAVPRGRPRPPWRCWSGWATRSCSRRRRPAAGRCTSTPATRTRRCRWCATTSRCSSRYDVAVAPSGSCVGSVRHQHAMVARRAGDEALAERAEAVAARTYELSELLVDVLGRRGRRRVLPAPGHLPPHLPLAADAAGRRQAAAAAAPRARHDLVELPAADQCCGFGGTFALKNADTSTAMLADKMRHVLSTGAEVLHRRRRVLPDAHRRRPVPAALRHAHGAPGRDPGASVVQPDALRPRRPMSTDLAMPAVAPRGVGAPARHAAVPGRRPHGAGRHPAAPQPRPRHRHDPHQARRGRRRARRLGGAAPRGRGDQDGHDGPPRRAARAARGSGHRPRRRRALGPRRRRGQPDRHRPGPRHRGRRGRQGQVDGHPGDRAQRGPREPRASRPRRPTSPS